MRFKVATRGAGDVEVDARDQRDAKCKARRLPGVTALVRGREPVPVKHDPPPRPYDRDEPEST